MSPRITPAPGGPFLARFFQRHGTVTPAELKRDLYRVSLSRYLPWIAYGAEEKTYYNADGTMGFLWEALPLTFAGVRTLEVARGLLRLPLPDYSVFQACLVADDSLSEALSGYVSSKRRADDLVTASARAMSDYLREGRRGLAANANIPVRNFRLFLSLKVPVPSFERPGIDLAEVWTSANDIFRQMELSPVPMPPERLLAWLRRLFNDLDEESFAYGDGREIRKQVIGAETEIADEGKRIRIGRKIFRCVTPLSMPPEVSLRDANELTGGFLGMSDDINQVRAPFMVVNNVIWADQRKELIFKTNVVLGQNGFGSWARTLARKQDEYAEASDRLHKGERYFRTMPIVWVWGENDLQVDQAVSQVRTLYQGKGYFMQEDTLISKVLFVSSLPMGLYSKPETVNLMERDFIASPDEIVPILPIQGDYAGSGPGPLIFLGRKGQAIGLDFYHESATSHNLVLFGPPGTGKSVALGYMAFQYYGTGALVRMLDIGRSQEKLTEHVGGRFLDLTDDSRIVFNPFTGVGDPEHDLPVVAAILLRMAYASQPSVNASQLEMTLMKDAACWAYREHGADALVDHAWHYLSRYPDHVEDPELPRPSQAEDLAHALAFNLKDFTGQGVYRRFFHGRSNFDLKSDPWVVLELSSIRERVELFNTVSLIVIQSYARELYSSPPGTRTVISCDEGHQYLANAEEIIKVILGDLYRKGRKNGGSIWLASQGINDKRLFGGVGQVIWDSSAFRMLLQSPDFDQAQRDGLISYDPFALSLLKSVATNKPSYSEIFLDTANLGRGVCRLVLDPFTYYLLSSDPRDNARINELMAQGRTRVEAMHLLAKERR